MDYQNWKGIPSFESIAACATRRLTLGDGEDAHSTTALATTGRYFSLLGVRPALGRLYDDGDDSPAAAPVAVLSHQLWQTRFGGDPATIGRPIELGQGTYTIIGVAPKGFTGTEWLKLDAWIPLRAASHEFSGHWETSLGNRPFRVLVRLAPGVPAAIAESEATAAYRESREAAGIESETGGRVAAGPVVAANTHTHVASGFVSQMLAAVSAIVLLIACANVANLLMARGIQRRSETAVRLAMGIGRRRLFAQSLIESLLLASMGGAAAILVSACGGWLRSILIPSVDWQGHWPTTRILLFTAGIVVVTGLTTGVVPALQACKRNVADELRSRLGERRGRAGRRVRLVLQTGQGILCAMLLVWAGLIVKSLHEIGSADLGFQPHGVLSVALETESGADVDLSAAYRKVEDRLAESLFVQSVSLTSPSPLEAISSQSLAAEGWDRFPAEAHGFPTFYRVGRDFFRVLRMRIVEGRSFAETDDRLGAPPVAVVNETMARRLWPDANALGKCLFIGSKEAPCIQVIGVVEDSRRERIVEGPSMLYYTPLKRNAQPPEALLVRADGDFAQLARRIRAEALAAAPEVRFVRITAMDDLLDPHRVSWRVAATLLSLFGFLALIVATVGLYSVLAFDITQRTHELGVRAAFGASAARLRAMVFRDAIRLTLVSLAVGVGLALASSALLSSFLYRVSPTDPAVVGAVVATLLLVGALAGTVPARKASRADPMPALRAE